jgi:hypothetical protein
MAELTSINSFIEDLKKNQRKKCKFCGSEFYNPHKNKIFCSKRCSSESCKIREKLYRNKNKEKFRLYMQKWAKENKNKTKVYLKKYRTGNLQWIMKNRLRARLRELIRKELASKKHSLLPAPKNRYGINYEKIIEHLKPIPKDIENYEIDHIIPLCEFNLLDPAQRKIAFSPENHQWLSKRENLLKGTKIIPSYLN